MIILVNKRNEAYVIGKNYEKFVTVDNERYFEVDNIPEVEGNKVLCFDPETKEFSTKERVIDKAKVEEYRKRTEAEKRKAYAMKWLTDNDWKVNKRMLGEWAEDDERWIAYLAGRAKARAVIDAADAVLKG